MLRDYLGGKGLRASLVESSIFLGPSLILAVQMSGKGFTNSFQTGGDFGLTLLWAVGLALLFKFCIVDGLARFTLARGDSPFSALPSLPGPKNWGVWSVILVYTLEIAAYSNIAIVFGQVIDEILPGEVHVTELAVFCVLVALIMLLWRSLGFLERVIYVIIAGVGVLLAYSCIAALLVGASTAPATAGSTLTVSEDLMVLLASGSGLSLLLYSVWVGEKIKRVPAGTNKGEVLSQVRAGLVLAFGITGLFSLAIIWVASAAGTDSIANVVDGALNAIPLAAPVFVLAVGLLMFGIVFVGVDGRARAIGRMLRQMGLTRMEKQPLYRVLVLAFCALSLFSIMVGQPLGILSLISAVSAAMFALAGFALAYLNRKLPPPYRAGRYWTVLTLVGSSMFLAIALVRERTMLEFGIPLLLRLAVIALILFYMVRSGALSWIVANIRRLKGAAAAVAIFSAISIFGTIGGIEYNGAVVNFRDLGAIMAGVLGGPVVGGLVGLIGGGFRYQMGGWTALPCFAATVFAGVASGLLSDYWKGKLSYLKLGFVGVLVELTHLLIIFPLLTLGSPPEAVLGVINNLTVPMLVTNLVGLMVFQYFIERWGHTARPIEDLVPASRVEGAEDGQGT